MPILKHNHITLVILVLFASQIAIANTCKQATSKKTRYSTAKSKKNILERLNEDEVKAIQSYSRVLYSTINSSLRDSNPSPSCNNVCNALAKLPDYEGVVYRGVVFQQEAAITLQEKLYQLQAGDIYSDKGLLSTSRSEKIVDKHFSGAGGVKFVINGLTGKDIGPISEMSHKRDEKEVIFLPETEFVVTKIKKDDYNNLTIYLDEISEASAK